MKKRFLALLMAAALCMSMLPAMAMATEETPFGYYQDGVVTVYITDLAPNTRYNMIRILSVENELVVMLNGTTDENGLLNVEKTVGDAEITDGSHVVRLSDGTEGPIVVGQVPDAPVTTTVALPEGEGYTVTPAEGSDPEAAEVGAPFSFAVEVAEGYDPETLVVTVDGVELEPVDGVYTIEAVAEGMVIEAAVDKLGEAPDTYTITFDPNGGSGEMEAVTVEAGDYTLPACGFTAPEGKEFDGWDKGAVGATIAVDADVTITAQWKDKATTPDNPDNPDNPDVPGDDDGYSPVSPVGPSASSKDDGGAQSGTTTPTMSYVDVTEANWYYVAVEYAFDNGMLEGVVTGISFDGDTVAPRGMIVAMMYNLEGKPAVTPATFQDLEAGAYYADGVAWAAANGIVNGYDVAGTTFGPNDSIQRQQMAAILFRYAAVKGYDTTARADLSGYTDAGQIADYAKDAMSWAVAEGIINGRTTTTLAPEGTITRAEVATMLMRLCQNVAK